MRRRRTESYVRGVAPKRTEQTSDEYELALIAPAWSQLRAMTGTESDAVLAKALRVSRATVYQTMTGGRAPSEKFVAHTLATFRFASFDKLFTWRAA